MLAALVFAVLIVGLSMLAGSVLLFALGARRPIWAEGAIGLAALTVVAGLAVRLPGGAVTAAVLILALLAAGSFAARKGFGPRGSPPDHRADLAGLAVLLILLAAACLPFLLEGRGGILGEGIYTNDHAAQLYWTDWLQNGFGPEPSAVAWGYPVGPQSLVAVIAKVTGASLVDVFNGLLLAIPALTGLAALSLLWRLRPVPRIAAASLAGLPFLAASFLAQSAFKETVMALFVLGFTAVFALATEPGGDDGRPDLDAVLPWGRGWCSSSAGSSPTAFRRWRGSASSWPPGSCWPPGAATVSIGGRWGAACGAIASRSAWRWRSSWLWPSSRRGGSPASSTGSETSPPPRAASARRSSPARDWGSGPRATFASSVARSAAPSSQARSPRWRCSPAP